MSQSPKLEWHRVPESGPVPSYTVYTGPIERADLDTREYRLFELDNGLRGMLFHDAEADKAAACVSIAVGALNDPVCALNTPSYHPAHY